MQAPRAKTRPADPGRCHFSTLTATHDRFSGTGAHISIPRIAAAARSKAATNADHVPVSTSRLVYFPSRVVA